MIIVPCNECGCKGIAETNVIALKNLNDILLKEIKELKEMNKRVQKAKKRFSKGCK